MSNELISENQKSSPAFGINAFTLKMIAIVAMLLDHIWINFAYHADWMTLIGRIAFPIFAFQIVEGYFHTKNLKKYISRMILFAFISEIPFNLMISNELLYPYHQNVIFTLLIGLLAITLIDKAKAKNTKYVYFMIGLIVSFIAIVLGFLSLVDYNGYGVLTILLFFFTRNLKHNKIYQTIGLLFINGMLMAGQVYIIPFFNTTIEIPQQIFAVFAMVPIIFYNGQKGPSSKVAQYAFYIFYPAHMLILYFIACIK